MGLATVAFAAVALAAGQAPPAGAPAEAASPAALGASLDASPGSTRIAADFRAAVLARVAAVTGGDPARLEPAEAFPPAAFTYFELSGGLGTTNVSRAGDPARPRTVLGMTRHAALLAGAAEAEVYREPGATFAFEVESAVPDGGGAPVHRVTLTGQGAVVLRDVGRYRVFVAGAPFGLRAGGAAAPAPAAPRIPGTPGQAAAPAALATSSVREAVAPSRPRVAKGGLRLGYFRPMLWLGGDFRGESVLIGPKWAIGLPRIDESSDGFGLELGGYEGEGFSSGLRYQRTRHPVPTLGPGGAATLSMFSLDVKGCSTPALHVQACFELGFVPYSHLDVKNDAVDATGRIGAAHFRNGLGFVLGAGVQGFLTSRISLQAGAAWQIVHYGKGAGFDDEPVETEDSVSLHALALHLGIAVDL